MTTSIIRILHECEPTLIEWLWDRRPSSRRKFAELYFEQCFTIENDLELIEFVATTVERNQDVPLGESDVDHRRLWSKIDRVRRGPDWQKGQFKYEHMSWEEYAKKTINPDIDPKGPNGFMGY